MESTLDLGFLNNKFAPQTAGADVEVDFTDDKFYMPSNYQVLVLVHVLFYFILSF